MGWGFSMLALFVGLAAGLTVRLVRFENIENNVASCCVVIAATLLGLATHGAVVSATTSYWSAQQEVGPEELDFTVRKHLTGRLCRERRVVGVLGEGRVRLCDANLEFELGVLQCRDRARRSGSRLLGDDLFVGGDHGGDHVDRTLGRGLGSPDRQEISFEFAIGRHDRLDLVSVGIATEQLGGSERHRSRFEDLGFVGDVAALIDVCREGIGEDRGTARVTQENRALGAVDGGLNV